MAKKNRKKLKRALSVMLTVSMLMSALSIPAMASEDADTGTQEPTVTVTVTVEKDETSGDTTTTTVTDKEWSSAEDIAVDLPDSGTETDSETGTETGSETEAGAAAEPEAPNTEVTAEGEKTVTGSETTTEVTIVNNDNKVIEESGNISGSETTTETTTVTESTTEKDVLIDETDTETQDTTTVDGETVITPDEDWTEVETSQGQWTQGATTEGTWETTSSTSETSADVKAEVTDPLDEGNVSLELKPGEKAEVTIDVDVQDVEKTLEGDTGFDPAIIEQLSKLPNGQQIKETSANKEVVYTPIYGEDGETLIGYEKTTTTITTDETIIDSTEKPSETVVGTQVTKTAPEGYEIGEEDSEGENGETIHTVTEPIYDIDNATIIGYKITKTTTSVEDGTETNESDSADITISETPEVTIILPEKPAESTTVDEATGETTKVTVSEVVENGQVVGYLSTTTKIDASGKELSSVTETLRGTVKTVTKTTVTDPTKEVVTTNTTIVVTEVTTVYGTTETRNVEVTTDRTVDTNTTKTVETKEYQLIETTEGLHFYYTGEMGTVTDNGKIIEKKLDMVPDGTLYNGSSWQTATDDIQGNGDGSINYSWYMRYTDAQLAAIKSSMKAGEYVLVGFGLYSEYNVKDDQGIAHAPRQYVVMDKDGNLSYGYCVELNAAIQWGGNNNGTYTEKDITKLEGEDVYFAEGKSAIEYISSVANNGFWGTTSGLGSLEAVKDLLYRNGEKEAADSITAGQALAATQATIWKYGTHSGGGSFQSINEVIEYYYNNNKDLTKTYTSAEDGEAYANIEALFRVLTTLAESDNGQGVGEVIDADALENATIILNSKAVDENGSTKTVVDSTTGTTRDLYNTDIAFTLAVSTSSINGDLLVNIIQDGVVIETRRLAGDDSTTQYGKIVPVDGVYTISGIELAEGVYITLKLEGTQHLAEGVYIYECENSQNFVGLTQTNQEVSLEVKMKFQVEEPDAEIRYSNSSETKEKNDTRTDTRTDNRTDSRYVEKSETDSSTETTTNQNTKIYADVTVTKVTEEVTKSERTWGSSWKNRYHHSTDDDDDRGSNDTDRSNDDYQLLEIMDDDVPLGNMVLGMLPATGDVSAMWMVLSLLSGLGLAGVTLAEKRRKED